ncbi:ArsR family transcriptional regulator [Mycolicibacterium moriokaense]|jgi:predicted ArsR family transcriptional regulator|uniref:helix-turn-helix transcriptional regulator n=1 Tax=Mycolicibacterium moriokaense TaxID=39691 RepID=UPI0009F70BD3|nr:helix-turn-helix domain-containing protein [Mycolicibacterium moriokaense]MCV7038890.1 ArsR family transcriptional regulator [Mycolicibacterium moriokaense]ORB25480.1 ArsR family transcriptional regulator [Mycolicibacterium moriokaense]
MPVPRHDLASPPERAAGQQRQKVLGLLQNASGPVDAQHVADSLQIHITTARFHLTTLEEQGYIRRGGGAKVARAGRPRLTYELAPRLDYADIVSLFAAHLGGTAEEREQRALRIGADLAHRVHLARKREETSIADLVVATLTELGFQVRSVLNSFGEVTVQLCTCPLAEVAATAPEVVRGIQQGLIQEVVDLNADAIGASYRVAVTPDPRGGSCEVGLILSPKK